MIAAGRVVASASCYLARSALNHIVDDRWATLALRQDGDPPVVAARVVVPSNAMTSSRGRKSAESRGQQAAAPRGHWRVASPPPPFEWGWKQPIGALVAGILGRGGGSTHSNIPLLWIASVRSHRRWQPGPVNQVGGYHVVPVVLAALVEHVVHSLVLYNAAHVVDGFAAGRLCAVHAVGTGINSAQLYTPMLHHGGSVGSSRSAACVVWSLTLPLPST